MSAIVLVTEAMARSSDSSQIYEKILEIINRLFAIQDSFVTELDESQDYMKILAHSGRSESQPEQIGSFTTLPGDILARAIQERAELTVLSKDTLGSMSGPMGSHLQTAKIQGLVLVPLLLREKVFGFLGLELPGEGRTITIEESSLLRIFATDIAQLIEDTRLFEQSKALITAEERNRLARDLHDSVTQVLYSASLIAEVLPQRFQRDPEAAIESAAELRRLTHGALAEMRTMLLELRPAGIVQLPLGELLTELIEAAASRSELIIQLTIDNVPLLPADVQISFYRIAQEALNNVVKHAQRCKVVLSLSATPPFGLQRLDQWDGEIRMVISDDGTGFSVEEQGFQHLGLGIMRERAAAIAAIFALESHLGQGTQVALTWHS
jgi:signal transduction histidine kinase